MNKITVPQAAPNWSNNNTVVAAIKYATHALFTSIGYMVGHTLGGGTGAEIAIVGAGYLAGRAAERVQHIANVRRIARQMPLIAREVQQLQRNGDVAGLNDLTRRIPVLFGLPAHIEDKRATAPQRYADDLPADIAAALNDEAAWKKIPGSREHSQAQTFYPQVPINPQAWEGAVAGWPASRNIEDRRKPGGAIPNRARMSHWAREPK